MRIENPPLPTYSLPTCRQAVPTGGRAGRFREGVEQFETFFRLNIVDLPSICQGEQSHAIYGNHDPL
jgi:hypothetical protein